MSSEKFEFLEDDLNGILDKLKKSIQDDIPRYFGEEKKSAKREVNKHFEEAAILMQEMEQESKMAPQSYRIQMMNKLRNYRGEIETLSRNFRMVSENKTFDSGKTDRESRMENSNRQKLFSGIESLQRTSESIARSQQVAAETDEIGTNIIEDMSRQREVLERTKGRLDETDANISKSRRIIKNIVRRVMTDKLILIAIILVEMAALGGVVYYKYFRK
ncbi:vesicle transport through interaction with t-SNAREs homolog 1B-like [Argonauta hians]